MVKREARENMTDIRKDLKKGPSLPVNILTLPRVAGGKTLVKKNSPEKKVRSKQKSWWKKKIGLRRKNFGRLDEWDTQPGMKKVSMFLVFLSQCSRFRLILHTFTYIPYPTPSNC